MAIRWKDHPEIEEIIARARRRGWTYQRISVAIKKHKGLDITAEALRGRHRTLKKRKKEQQETVGYDHPLAIPNRNSGVLHLKSEGAELKFPPFFGNPEPDPEPKPPSKKQVTEDNLRVMNFIKEQVPPMTAHVSKSGSKAGDSLVIHLTDWHVGKEIKDEVGKVLFNEEIFSIRIEKLIKQMLSLIDGHIKQGTPLKEAYVLTTGDLVDGMGIFKSQPFQTEMAPPYQVMVVVRVIQGLLLALLDRDLEVFVKEVMGNHGEVRDGGKALDPLANWDLMVYLILQLWGEQTIKSGKLHFQHSEQKYLNFEIQGWRYHIRHIAPVQAETAAGKAKFLGWIRKHKIDALVYGHFHHWNMGDRSRVPVFRGGSLTGADELAEDMAEESDPVQLIWGVSKKRPLTFSYAVDLGEKGKR